MKKILTAISFILLCLLFINIKPAFTQTNSSVLVCKLGTYITSIHDLNPNDKSFSADFWLWSLCPTNIKPLENMEVVNAKKTAHEISSDTEIKGLYLSQRKFKAVLNHNWITENFPFDSQTFKIELEDGSDDVSKLMFEPDIKNSNYNPAIVFNDQRITKFNIQEKKHQYPTTFGDPSITKGSKYSRIVITVKVVRNGLRSFLKLNTGTYIAFLLALVSFLMSPVQTSVFSARMSLLVGSLFAVVINLRASESFLGRAGGFGLVDKIHLLTMIYIFMAAILAILSQKLCDVKKDKLALRYDHQNMYIFGISFIAFNFVMILQAAISS
jgi:hypothetical protein